ncbi:response regulator [Paramagnetospirillum marisnigri]|uniref:Response regulator n=2 Tax=Paramagnetospirillum marisnigri TaxID=1285242 RepID=A0A178MUB7_9PROT|nr:response regulator [Paramagnetospirillum marisnigri]
MRRLITTILSALRVTDIVEARSTTAAAPLIGVHNPHLVVMDWSADHTEGMLFVHRLRRGEIGASHTPVLALAKDHHHAVLEEALEAGIDEVVAKPLSALELMDRATTLIAQARRHLAGREAALAV